MSILTIIFVLIIVGVLLWLVNTYIPMDKKIRSIINILVVLVVVVWLLQSFGIIGSIGNMRIT